MTTALFIASFLAVAIGIAHSYLGERYILVRLFRRTDLPRLFGGTEFTIRTLRFAWHLTTIAWLGFATILALLAQGLATPANISLAIGTTFVLSGLIALITSRGRHISWLVFLAIGGTALYAAAA